MAWRSWNAFLADIDDPLIRQNIEALVAKTRSAPDSLDLAPGPSLWDAGYTSIGIDEGERHRRCCSVLHLWGRGDSDECIDSQRLRACGH